MKPRGGDIAFVHHAKLMDNHGEFLCAHELLVAASRGLDGSIEIAEVLVRSAAGEPLCYLSPENLFVVYGKDEVERMKRRASLQ